MNALSFVCALIVAVIFFCLSLYEALGNNIGWSIFLLVGSCVAIVAAYLEMARDLK